MKQKCMDLNYLERIHRKTPEHRRHTIYDVINMTGRRLEAIDFCVKIQSEDPVLFQKGTGLANYLGFEAGWSGYYLVLSAILAELVEIKRV